MNNLQDQGRACYKRGDFKKAIEVFDRAIGRSPSVQLLDNRAACYEKLGEFQTALKDAKKTIQLHREDAVGYLRAGRVLVKMNKASVALEIYTHGLKSIKHVGQGYEQLRKVHKELMDQLCPPKSVDPLTVLPRELAETILEYLSFRQRMNASLVSKGWTQFIRSMPNLWSHLDLSSAKRKVRTSFISRAVNTARTRLKTATLSNLFDFDKTLSALIKHCQLEDLTLLDCGYQGLDLTRNLMQAKALRSLRITQGTVFSAVELAAFMSAQSDSLEVLDCWTSGNPDGLTRTLHLPKLKFLSLSFRKNSDPTRFLDVVPSGCPALQSLTVYHDSDVLPRRSIIDLQNCLELRYLDFHIEVHDLQHQLRVPSGLNTLKIDRPLMRQIPQYQLPRLQELGVHACARQLHQIEHLLDTSTAEMSAPPDDLQTKPSGLHTLFVTRAVCGGIDDAHRLLSNSRLESLHTLCLSCCSGIDDSVAAVIAASELKKLRYLDLTRAELTGVGVKVLVKSLNVETLVLNDCANVSPDAVEWARAKGVKVKYRMGGEPSGGRKVRY